MTHLNNSISEKAFQWKAESNAFSGNARVFKLLKADGYTHVEFVAESGTVLHKATVPGAEATLGTYATRANNMLREGCTWEEAKSPRKAIGPQGTGIRKGAVSKIWYANACVHISAGDAIVSIDSELNVTGLPVRYNEADSMSRAFRLAEAFVQNCVSADNGNWLTDNFKGETWAVAGEHRVSIAAGATMIEAQQALTPLVAVAGNWAVLGETKIIKTGFDEVAAWTANIKAARAAHE